MAIYRGRLPGDNYTMIPTAWLRDSRLSLTAKGILVFLTTVPPGQSIAESEIINSGRADDEAEVIDALAELEATGYLRRDASADLWLSTANRAG